MPSFSHPQGIFIFNVVYHEPLVYNNTRWDSRLNEEKVVGDEVEEAEASECPAKRICFYF